MINDLDVETGERMPTAGSIASLPQPETSAEKSDTQTRALIAIWLLVLLAVIVAVAFIALFLINYFAHLGDATADAAAKRLMDLMNVVFGPVVTLISSVVGFYFGARTAEAGVNANNSG